MNQRVRKFSYIIYYNLLSICRTLGIIFDIIPSQSRFNYLGQAVGENNCVRQVVNMNSYCKDINVLNLERRIICSPISKIKTDNKDKEYKTAGYEE